MAEPVAGRLIQMIDAISVVTEDTMPMTAIASASEDVEAGAKRFNIKLRSPSPDTKL